MNKIDLKKLTSIDDDFALWAAEQAALVRASKFDRVDIENVAGELDYLGNSQESEIESRLDILIMHLLKWQYQPSGRCNSWRASIREQRNRIARVVKRSPSLRTYPATAFLGSFSMALYEAQRETGLPESAFPEACPYTIQQILDPDYLPGER